MLGRIHQKLGTVGLIVSVVALVAALAGTAFAATKLNSVQKKEVVKIAKKYAGKPGSAGVQGPTGPQGATGPAGTTGAEGPQGEEGPEGPTGPTGPAGTQLPSGQTSTGGWSFAAKGVFGTLVTISFPLRVEPAPNYNWMAPGASSTANCPGTASNPKAAAGQLCVYAKEVVNAGFTSTHEPVNVGNDTVDANSHWTGEFEIASGEEGYGYGSWAVTAK